MNDKTVLLDIQELDVTYRRRGLRTRLHRAVSGVNLSIARGKTLGLVGESGSGKSTIGRAVVGLVRPARGRILFEGNDLAGTAKRARREMSSRIQMIFQDPYSSLNPTKTIEESLREPLEFHQRLSSVDAGAKVRGLLDHVGLPTDAARRLPRDFSGGQRQRIAIARALAVDPELIVCDEPTSALDLSTQATVLNLLLDLQRELGLTYLFISHDLAVVRHMAHDVAVLEAGRIVESGPADAVTARPTQEYTQRLIMASPVPDPIRQRERRTEFRLLDAASKGNTP